MEIREVLEHDTVHKLEDLTQLCQHIGFTNAENVDVSNGRLVAHWAKKQLDEIHRDLYKAKLQDEIDGLKLQVQDAAKERELVESELYELEQETLARELPVEQRPSRQGILNTKPEIDLKAFARDQSEELLRGYKMQVKQIRDTLKGFDIDKHGHSSLVSRHQRLSERLHRRAELEAELKRHDGLSTDVTIAREQIVQSRQELKQLNQKFEEMISTLNFD